jgi:hypothetical protein
MQDLQTLIGQSFQSGVSCLGLSVSDFYFVHDDGRYELNYEHTQMVGEGDTTDYLITFTITESVDDEDEIESNFFVNPDTFNYAGYWHFEELK